MRIVNRWLMNSGVRDKGSEMVNEEGDEDVKVGDMEDDEGGQHECAIHVKDVQCIPP